MAQLTPCTSIMELRSCPMCCTPDAVFELNPATGEEELRRDCGYFYSKTRRKEPVLPTSGRPSPTSPSPRPTTR